MDEKTFNKLLTKALAINNGTLLGKVKEYVDQALTNQSHDMRDFTRQEIKASENRLTKRMDERFDGQKQEIINAIAESVDYFILPRLVNVEKRLLKLEAKTA